MSVLDIKLTLTLDVELTLDFGHPTSQPKLKQISTSYNVVCLLDKLMSWFIHISICLWPYSFLDGCSGFFGQIESAISDPVHLLASMASKWWAFYRQWAESHGLKQKTDIPTWNAHLKVISLCYLGICCTEIYAKMLSCSGAKVFWEVVSMLLCSY